MHNDDNRALNAVWNTDVQSQGEKLVLAHLATKHELGNKFSSGWKPLEQFIADFQDRWCSLNEIEEATRLSPVKATQTIAALVSRDLVKVTERPKVGKRRKEGAPVAMEQVVALTPKIFNDYQMSGTANKPLAAVGGKRRSA